MSDPLGIANTLNEYFCNIDKELQAQFTDTDDQYLTYQTKLYKTSFCSPLLQARSNMRYAS